MRRHQSAALVLLALSSSACARMCAAEDVAMGVARLTTLNADALVSALDKDRTCGFSSARVLETADFDPDLIGRIGTISWIVKDCELDLGTEGVETGRNCKGERTRAFGRATVSGVKTVTGYLTGDPYNAVIPSGPDVAHIVLNGTFDRFSAVQDGNEAVMTWVSGGISGELRPRLAAAADTGACAVQTKNVSFANVRYRPSSLHLQAGDTELELEIQGSNLEGQFGKYGERENVITGSVDLWDQTFPIPPPGAEPGLDPEYDATSFVEDFSCGNIALPVRYECDLSPLLAQNAARALVKVVGTANGLLENDRRCGFSSNASLGTLEIFGSPGAEGYITFDTGEEGCLLEFPTHTVLPPDCNGHLTIVHGSVRAYTMKKIEGMLTGSIVPLYPTSREAASFEHQALVFENFTVYGREAPDADVELSITFSGTISGRVRPVAGENAHERTPENKPLYDVGTPVAAFDDLVVSEGSLTLVSAGRTFVLDVSGVRLNAFNGTSSGLSNRLSGRLTVNGARVATLPEPKLDPAFEQAAFDAAYACNPDLKEPVPSR